MKPWLFSLLAWWALEQQTLLVQPEPARLILYREKEFISGLKKAYAFKINDQKVGKLSPNRYVDLSIPAGRIKIEFFNTYLSDSRPLWLQVQPGQTYYVKTVVDVDFMSATLITAPVNSQQAQRELLRMRPEPADPTPQPD